MRWIAIGIVLLFAIVILAASLSILGITLYEAGLNFLNWSAEDRLSIIPIFMTILLTLFAGLTWAVYERQARIMERQTDILEGRGPDVHFMNTLEEEQVQQGGLFTYEELPRRIKDWFPEAQQPPSFALLNLAFTNSGDRTGYVRIMDIEEASVDSETDDSVQEISKGERIWANWFSSYLAIPANGAAVHESILVKIKAEEVKEPKTISLRVRYAVADAKNEKEIPHCDHIRFELMRRES